MPEGGVFLLVIYTALMSVMTFAAYGRDKSSAQHQRRRTPEAALHLLSLAGGWPGALAGQQLLRHKTRKQPFRLYFWSTVVVNLILLVVVVTAAAMLMVAPG